MDRLFINLTKPGKVGGLVGMFLSQNVEFSRNNDCVELDYCDKVCEKFCEEMGWGEDLENVEFDVLQ